METSSPHCESTSSPYSCGGPEASFGRIVAAGFSVAALVTFAFHSFSYFFLFDDFALVGDSAEYSARSIVTTSLFGFYRPVAFLVTKGNGAVAHWDAPWIYAAASILLHGLNALLVRLYSQRLGLQPAHARLAAVVFLLSPWASETYFWTSARFDLLATFGLLTTLLIGLWGVSAASRAKLAAAVVLSFASTAFAAFSKESAVVAPVLMAGTLCAARSTRARFCWPGLLLVASSALAIGVYLLVRQQIASALGGAYGSLPGLLAATAFGPNLWKYLRALLLIPLPGAFAVGGIAVVAILAFAFLAALAGVRSQPRVSLLAVTAFLLSLLPVIWIGLPQSGSGGGRVLYAPGLWFCVLLGLAAGAETARMRAATRLVVSCALATMLASVVYEAVVWRQASILSKLTIRQLEPYRDSQEKLFIANMPFWYSEGPYITKDYAFSRYFAPTATQVRGRAMELSYATGAARFTKWASLYGELTPSLDERVVFLELPVSGIPLVPASPQALQADVRGRNVTLTWTRGVGGGHPAGFAIEVSLDPAFATVLATLDTEHGRTDRLVEQVPPNRYFVRVVAFNADGNSQPSPVVCVVVD